MNMRHINCVVLLFTFSCYINLASTASTWTSTSTPLPSTSTTPGDSPSPGPSVTPGTNSTNMTSPTPGPTPTTETLTTLSPDQEMTLGYSIQHSALFTCSVYLFNDNMYQIMPWLFPPADNTIDRINKMPVVFGYMHQSAITSLCGQVDAYSKCVKQTVLDYPNAIDKVLQKYFNFSSFDTLLQEYCENKDLVMSQFKCVQQVVTTNKCLYGGIHGIAEYAFVALNENLDHASYCKQMKTSVNCRVNNQLKKCHRKQADIMERMYNSFIACA